MSAVDTVMAAARSALGKPYVFGDEGPNTFDCSGLMQYSFGAAGVSLPRTAAEQQAATARVATPLPGDLVFYGDPAYHVGLYVGAGKMIAAPEPGDVVKVQAVYGSPTYGRVSGIGTATAPVFAAVSDVGLSLSSVLGPARGVALESLAVAAGLALVAVGMYQVTRPAIARGLGNMTEGTF